MKFAFSMLQDFVRTQLSASEVGDLLTMAGFELEGIEQVEGEPVLDIKVVSNRGDGLSVFGLSREILAKDSAAVATELYHAAANRFENIDAGPVHEPSEIVRVSTPDCTRYGALVFRAPAGRTPHWMAARLRQAGMRPISLLVDVTNYTMLEIGQPLHAFDREKLSGGRIVVRQAVPGEKLTTLNEVEHELRPDQMMICDAEKPVAAAGIMGGLSSEVTDVTTEVLLESAHFVNTSVRRTRKQLGLSTEASYRFERSVDRELMLAGLRRCLQLLREATSQPIPAELHLSMGEPDSRTQIELRPSRAVALLGMDLTQSQAKTYLERLGFSVEICGENLLVERPSWRPDIDREVDLIEELGRVHGYEKIPEELPRGSVQPGGVHGAELRVDQLRTASLGAGFSECVSHSMAGEHPLDLPGSGRVQPRVPASPEMALLRNSLLPGLADAAQRNGGRNLALFEIGRVFRQAETGPLESRSVAWFVTGIMNPADRKVQVGQAVDFYRFKGSVLAALGSIGVMPQMVPSSSDVRLHPTRQAVLVGPSGPIGVLGQLHPDVQESLGLPDVAIVCECDWEAALQLAAAELSIRSVSRNPAVLRDLSVLVSKSVSYARLEEAVRRSAGEVLERLSLFDTYEGKGVPEGMHSLGIRLQLRKLGENFTDEEANQVRLQVVAELEQLGATLR